VPPDPLDDAADQLCHDLVRLQVDPGVLADVSTGLGQRVADQGVRVLGAPAAAVLCDQGEFALDPVRLGVDEGAVEVPQDGGE
jgi:hypothetical protein